MKILVILLLTSFISSSIFSDQNNDPFEKVNKLTHQMNDELDKVVAKPVAKLYKKVTPDIIEIGLSNSISNIEDISIGINNILQGKIKDGLSDFTRFTVNSTFGLMGLFDIASDMGLEKHNEDFGQTVAVWGVPHGPYIVLPGLGPSSLRDSLSLIPDAILSPSLLFSDDRTIYGIKGVDLLITRADLLGIDVLIVGDEYLFMKDAYFQNREYDIKDGLVEDDFDTFDDWEE